MCFFEIPPQALRSYFSFLRVWKKTFFPQKFGVKMSLKQILIWPRVLDELILIIKGFWYFRD